MDATQTKTRKTRSIRTLATRAARCDHAHTIELHDDVRVCIACEAVLR